MNRMLLLCYLISYLYLIFHLTFGFDLMNLRLKHWVISCSDPDEFKYKVHLALSIIRARFYLALIVYFVSAIFLAIEDSLFVKHIFFPSMLISIIFLVSYDRVIEGDENVR